MSGKATENVYLSLKTYGSDYITAFYLCIIIKKVESIEKIQLNYGNSPINYSDYPDIKDSIVNKPLKPLNILNICLTMIIKVYDQEVKYTLTFRVWVKLWLFTKK